MTLAAYEDDAKYFFDWDAYNASKKERFWTDERTNTLTTMWIDGCRALAIANLLGTTRSAVIGKANRLMLPAHPRPFRDFHYKGGRRKSRKIVPVRYPNVKNLDATKLPAVARWLDGNGDSVLGFDRVTTLFNDNRDAFAGLFGKRHQQFTAEFRFDVWRIPHEGLHLWLLTAKSKGTCYEVEAPPTWKAEDEYNIIAFLSDLYDELKAREDHAAEVDS